MEPLVLEAKFYNGHAREGKSSDQGIRKPSAKSALWPQVSHFTWGLIIHGSFDNLCSLYPTELELWGAAGQIMGWKGL